MARMKIAYLLGSLNRGGTETLLLDIFNYKGRVPFDFIGIYRKDGVLSENFRSSGRKILKLTPGRVWMLFVYLWRLRQSLKHEKIEIVHAQQNLDTVYARLAIVGLNIKLVQTIHGFDMNIGHFNKFLVSVSLKICNASVFVSKTQQKYFEKAYRIRSYTKQAIVYNGINFDKFSNKEKTSIRSEFGISETSFLLGMVGNFVPGHDQLTICRFIALLSKGDINFYFLFIGKKDESNPLLFEDCVSYCSDNGLTDKVLFLGSRSDVPGLLAQLDAFFYSTDHDTFGISVIEAIATGIPVFVNDWEVMKEITENGKRVMMYRTRDEIDLLNKFISLIEQPAKFKKSATENAEWARKTYNIQTHLDNLFQVYNRIN